MAINSDKAKKFIEQHKDLIERFDKDEAERQAKLAKQSQQFESFDKVSKSLIDRMKQVQELKDAGLPVDIPNLELISQGLSQALGQQAQLGLEMFNTLNPPQAPETNTTGIRVPNPNDPSGFDEIEIDNDRLDRIMNDPEFMREEVARLLDQGDATSQVQLKAIEQIMGDRMTAPINEDIVRVQGTEITEEQIRQPGLLSRDSRDVLSAATTEQAINTQKANATAPIESRIKNSIADGIRKVAAQRREKLGL